jgi:predicted metal-dependent hydrolase
LSTHKSPKIQALLEELEVLASHEKLDRRYLGFFECFNRQIYYEAHDVLEDLWLEVKGDRHFFFYKGLIQLAGAFVHLKKGKLNPAARLFRLSLKNISDFQPVTLDLDVKNLVFRINEWLDVLEKSDYTQSPYHPTNPPVLKLTP